MRLTLNKREETNRFLSAPALAPGGLPRPAGHCHPGRALELGAGGAARRLHREAPDDGHQEPGETPGVARAG